jgi:hypothetical protein
MSVTWPSELPKFRQQGYAESPPDNTVRNDPDGGPALARKKYTAGVGQLKGTMSLTAAQVETLDQFYRTFGGFTEFSMTHPRTGADITCRIIEPPAHVPAGGGRWNSTVSLEVLV